MRISDVLQAIQKKAFEIVEILILQNEGKTDCADVATTGDLANRMMRLCTVALFEEEVEHAEVALGEPWRQGSLDNLTPSLT